MSVRDDRSFVDAGTLAFIEAAADMDLPCTARIVSQVESWLRFYGGWVGRRVVGFTGAADIAVKLIADSFAMVHAVPRPEGTRGLSVVDIGSGNGWPGLAARMLWDDADLTLLDSRLGACEFMEKYIAWASVEKTRVAPLRAEDAPKTPQFREQFDLVVSRAMARPGVALELSVLFGRPAGLLALWLGPDESEIVAKRKWIPEIGVSLTRAHAYELSGGKGRRLLAVYRREAAPMKGFPRNLSSIKAKPLL